ncbi:GDSL-type esterase/lipase family protein [Paenibacillus arenilitoris]|uniref:S-layer homology domain-containing protein n=1 Tax=Paenibacillus arenilitoris TaxID=2772299 RepID=A0A927CFU1_9BACL|nr:GDSL-type esterase/lipase family protein [Paenibacillus arenilitoris]MBD2867299.1 S-layer homology domain-containing protein [Paenibacillus arenilitoris]
MNKHEPGNTAGYKFNFSCTPKTGYTQVCSDAGGRVPLYDEASGLGFVEETCAVPPRAVHADSIRMTEEGCVVCEAEFMEEPGFESEHYNRFGMAFRMKAPAGAYEIRVKTAGAGDADISVSGMHGGKILAGGYWDVAGLVPIRSVASASGRDWTYTYVNGRAFIDIEIEPKQIGLDVGLAEIELVPLPPKSRPAGALPTIFTLGDSTVKSYTFEEAPMSGWGQVFDDLFDPERVNVVNYSMGGRSFKNAYWEGRLNDILLTANAGDYLLIQFGHNDEKEDELHRFGRGSLEASYEAWIKEAYIPAIRARGVHPVLVTPISRINGEMKVTDEFVNSFNHRKFPDIMKRVAAELGVDTIDLNAESLRYYREIGAEAALAIVMSIEAGETPGKTNDGSYANGHPANKIDGTHYKEALAKPFARIVAEGLVLLEASGSSAAAEMAACLKASVKEAIASGDWSHIYPEMAADITTGRGSYYRNQIEKLLQLGVMTKDANGLFHPERVMTVQEFVSALARLMRLEQRLFAGFAPGGLTREVMGAILLAAYEAAFKAPPKYMTDYNGSTAVPGSPGYDPNLDSGAQGAMYDPLVPFDRLTDTDTVDPALAVRVKAAYELGLIRSEAGIARGRMVNGTELEPKKLVTREKAAKALYYMWVLVHPVRIENDSSRLDDALEIPRTVT